VIRRLFRSAAVAPRPADADDLAGGDPATAVINGYQFATDPEDQRREMLSLVVVQGRNGPRAFLDNVSAALSGAMAADDALDDPEVDKACQACKSIRTVVAGIQREIDDEIAAFTGDAHTVLGDVLTDCENRARAEGEVDDTLRKVAVVRAANTPGGEVSVFTLGKLVALTKARRMIPEGSWQAKVIDEHAVGLASAGALAGLGFGARGAALVVRGPATAYRAQGGRVLELTATDAGPSGEDVNALAAEILARAPAPAL
jgi:hypothetical protein